MMQWNLRGRIHVIGPVQLPFCGSITLYATRSRMEGDRIAENDNLNRRRESPTEGTLSDSRGAIRYPFDRAS